MIRGFNQAQKNKPIPSPIDLREVINEHRDLLKAITDKREALQKIHDDSLQAHEAYLNEIGRRLDHIDRLIATVKMPAKGDKGDKPIAGVDFPYPVDHYKIVDEIMKRLPPPRHGQPGKDGADAVAPEIDHAEVAKEVVKLIPKAPKINIPTVEDILKAVRKNLKVEHIPGLRAEIDSYRSQLAGKHYGENTLIRGGGDTIAAGTNVTITTTNGVKTISTPGGFTVLGSTETPNGNITVFTFSAATAKPSFVISDNVLLRSTTKSGTVNWTWSAGTLQVTMTIPPQDEILAVV